MDIYDDGIFDWPYDGGEPDSIAREYFDIMYSSGWFMESLEYWVQGNAICTDGAWCRFGSEDSEFEELRFDGVEFEIGFNTPPIAILVDERTFYRWARMACERYMKKHPEDNNKVKELMQQFPS